MEGRVTGWWNWNNERYSSNGKDPNSAVEERWQVGLRTYMDGGAITSVLSPSPWTEQRQAMCSSD